MVVTEKETATKGIAKFSKEDVVKLILDWKTVDEKFARQIMVRENARCPEWELFGAVRDAMKAAA